MMEHFCSYGNDPLGSFAPSQLINFPFVKFLGSKHVDINFYSVHLRNTLHNYSISKYFHHFQDSVFSIVLRFTVLLFVFFY